MKNGELNLTSALSGKAEATADRGARPANGKDPKAIDKAAREFEAYFVQTMLKEMRKTIEHSDMLGDRHATEIFESMFDEALGKSVAAGKGLGLAARIRSVMGVDEQGAEPAHLPIAPAAAPYATGYPHAVAMHTPFGVREPSGPITSGFGERLHPSTGELDFHPGIDIAMAEGTPVYAAAPGKVVYSGEMQGYGNLVIVEHADGYTTRYAHNSRLLVEVGQEVGVQTQLAESGSTGYSTGPHLHFEVRRDGVAIDPRSVRWALLP